MHEVEVVQLGHDARPRWDRPEHGPELGEPVEEAPCLADRDARRLHSEEGRAGVRWGLERHEVEHARPVNGPQERLAGVARRQDVEPDHPDERGSGLPSSAADASARVIRQILVEQGRHDERDGRGPGLRGRAERGRGAGLQGRDLAIRHGGDSTPGGPPPPLAASPSAASSIRAASARAAAIRRSASTPAASRRSRAACSARSRMTTAGGSMSTPRGPTRAEGTWSLP